MKKNLIFFTLIVSGVLFFAACKKDNKVSKSKTEYLTQQTWKVKQLGGDLNNDGTIDTPIDQPCLTDNTISFKSDGTGTWDEGATKCDASAPQTNNFTWSFSNNETEISYDGTNYKILTLNDTSFDISSTQDIGGVPTTVILQLIH